MGIDLQVLKLFLDTRQKSLELFIGVIFASKDGKRIGVFRLHNLKNANGRIFDGVGNNFKLAIGNADYVAIVNGIAVNVLRILDCTGDLACFHVFACFGHGFDVFL